MLSHRPIQGRQGLQGLEFVSIRETVVFFQHNPSLSMVLCACRIGGRVPCCYLWVLCCVFLSRSTAPCWSSPVSRWVTLPPITTARGAAVGASNFGGASLRLLPSTIKPHHDERFFNRMATQEQAPMNDGAPAADSSKISREEESRRAPPSGCWNVGFLCREAHICTNILAVSSSVSLAVQA